MAVFLCMGGLIMGNLLQDTVGHSDSGRSLAQHGKPMGVYKSTNKYRYAINIYMYITYIVYDIYSYIYILHICDAQQIGFHLQTCGFLKCGLQTVNVRKDMGW